LWSGLLLTLLAVQGGCNNGPNGTLSVIGQWDWEVMQIACQLPGGFLYGGDDFSIGAESFTMNGDQGMSQANFTDQAGNLVSIYGGWGASGFRADTTVQGDGWMIRGLMAGAVSEYLGATRVDGFLTITEDSTGTCLGAKIPFWATVGGALNEQEIIEVCPPVDIVFLMDTSGSMDDEAQALCDSISGVADRLAQLGLTDFQVTLLGITEDAGDDPDFPCLTDNARDLLGASVPGTPSPGEENLNDSEDWGPGTAVVAGRFAWRPGAIRIVVPISDEAPENGDKSGTPDCDATDQAAIDNAISVALANNVIVSPIVASESGQDPCIEQLAQQLANATGGTLSLSTDPQADIADSIFQIVVDACEQVVVSD